MDYYLLLPGKGRKIEPSLLSLNLQFLASVSAMSLKQIIPVVTTSIKWHTVLEFVHGKNVRYILTYCIFRMKEAIQHTFYLNVPCLITK